MEFVYKPSPGKPSEICTNGNYPNQLDFDTLGSMKRIVILGAGYAGLAALQDLRVRVNSREAEIVFVNQHPYHTFITELHTLAGGDRRAEEVTVPLHSLESDGVKVRIGTVEKIDWQNDAILLEDGTLEYDYCLIGLGSHPETFGIEGVKENALFLNSLQSAEQIRQRLRQLAKEAKASGKTAEVSIAGGGLTGIELAGEIAHHYRGLIQCTILEAMNQLIPGFDAGLAETAEVYLTRRGVRILKNDPIQKVTERLIVLKSGKEVSTDLLVWSAGVRANSIVADSGLQTDRKGRGLVDEYLHSVDRDHLYLIGDCAAINDPETGRPLPPTAQLAVQMGRHVAEMIPRRMHGYVELPFRPEVKGFFASLGPGMGIGKMGCARLKGKTALLVKWMVEAQHAFESAGTDYVVKRIFRPRTSS